MKVPFTIKFAALALIVLQLTLLSERAEAQTQRPAPGTFLRPTQPLAPVPVGPQAVGSESITLPPLELPSLAPPIVVSAIGGALGLTGGILMLGLAFDAIVTTPDTEYDDEGNEIDNGPNRLKPAGIAMFSLFGAAAVVLPVGLIWLRKRRHERMRIVNRRKQEREYLDTQGTRLSLGVQAGGAKLRLSF